MSRGLGDVYKRQENGAVLGKKEAAYAAACGENGGAVEVGGCIWNGRALACA
jgi:hypothetical protein